MSARGGVGQDNDEPQTGGDGGTVQGTLSTFGFSLPDEIATTRVDAFRKAYPQVQVKITEGGFDEQQFLSAVASGAPPDLVMTEAGTWVAAARARAEARAKKNLPFTGLYSGNKVADEQVFGEVYKPSGEAKFDEAVQTVLGVQDVAFATPPSPAAAEFQKAWQDAVNRVS